jgi:ATP-dependent exoDNAse (exonuclease V) beta subunit
MLQKWEDKRELGTIIHHSLSEYIKSGGVTQLHESISDWIKEQLDMLINADNITLYSEQIIYSKELNLAGTVDLIVDDKFLKEMYIIDFKTDKTLTTYYHTKNEDGLLVPCSRMLYPYDSYYDTNLNHYKVQILKYSEILNKNGYLCNPKNSEIWHLPKSKIYDDLWKPYQPKIKL